MGYKLKPNTFDGSVPLREFFSQFNLIARANCQNNATKKKIVLASSLREKARSVLESVEDLENCDFEELKLKLELRYGKGQLSKNYYSQFANRRQKFGEDFATFDSELEIRLAYSECFYTRQNCMSAVYFFAFGRVYQKDPSVRRDDP